MIRPALHIVDRSLEHPDCCQGNPGCEAQAAQRRERDASCERAVGPGLACTRTSPGGRYPTERWLGERSCECNVMNRSGSMTSARCAAHRVAVEPHVPPRCVGRHERRARRSGRRWLRRHRRRLGWLLVRRWLLVRWWRRRRPRCLSWLSHGRGREQAEHDQADGRTHTCHPVYQARRPHRVTYPAKQP